MRTRLMFAAIISLGIFAACVQTQPAPTPEGTPTPTTPEPVVTGAKATFAALPSTGSYAVGQQFTVDFMLDSGQEPVDAVDIVASFSSDTLTVVDADPAKEGTQVGVGTAFETYPLNEVKDGEIRVGASSLTSTPTGSNKVVSVTFQGTKPGTAQVNFGYTPGSHSDTDVMSAVNSEDILSNVGNGTYTITQ